MIAAPIRGVIISPPTPGAWLHKSALAVAEGYAGLDPARKRISAAAFFPQGHRRNRTAKFQRGAAGRHQRHQLERLRWICASRQCWMQRSRSARCSRRRECEAAGVTGFVVPAKAGTHSHRCQWWQKVSASVPSREPRAYGPGSWCAIAHRAGTTKIISSARPTRPSPNAASPRRAVRGSGS